MESLSNTKKMKRIAIISFYHIEASICLAKYLGLRNDIEVDYYFIADVLRDKGFQSGIDYHSAFPSAALRHTSHFSVPKAPVC